MDIKHLAKARADLLKAEISRTGLTTVANKAKKPVRQINDMAAGRKPFGDRISKEIGPLIRPDLPRDWLLFPGEEAEPPAAIQSREPDIDPYIAIPMPKTKRELRIEAIHAWLERTDEDGLLILLHEAEKAAGKFPLAKQTRASSQ